MDKRTNASLARFPQSEYAKIFERYIKGESLASIHKDYKDEVALAAIQLYASRHSWCKFKNSIKLELKKAQIYKDEKQTYSQTVTTVMESMAESKKKRIEMSNNFMDMIYEHSKSQELLEPKQLSILASAFSVVSEIQRTEYGEASLITQNNNLNANVTLESQRKLVSDLESELQEYIQQQ